MTAPRQDPMARLEGILRDLEGYVERRAAELAAPLIAEADKRTEEKEAELQHEIERREDLAAEYRRLLAARDRQIARWREIATREAADLILSMDELLPGDRFLDSGCLYTLLRVDTYDDHLGFSVEDEDGKRWSLSGQPASLTAVRREVKP